MAAMNAVTPPIARPRSADRAALTEGGVGRWLLLVAVLVGLVGMHALGSASPAQIPPGGAAPPVHAATTLDGHPVGHTDGHAHFGARSGCRAQAK